VLDFVLSSAAVLIITAAVVAMAWCFRRIRRRVTVKCAMRGFDREVREILSPHPGRPGNGHPARYNDPDTQ
jgi:hypothetical protein